MNSEKRIIMLVDDNMSNLTTGKNILKDKYNIYPISSGEKLFEIMEKITPDLILLDVLMPDMDGYEVIKRLKASAKTKEIPVIFLTSKDDPADELDGLALGAVDYISKPFSPVLLQQRIKNHLFMSSGGIASSGIEDLQYAVIRIVSEMVEFHSESIGGHIERTQRNFKIMLEKMIEEELYIEESSGWNHGFMVHSAMLHDVGKIMIDSGILNKPGRLSGEEFEEVKKHPDYGIRVIDKISDVSRNHSFLEYARVIAGTHHEWWDGTGYPNGLAGNEIPLPGRLMAIVDVYDALISQRSHKEPIGRGEVEQMIINGSGTQFDPALIEVFKKISGDFSVV